MQQQIETKKDLLPSTPEIERLKGIDVRKDVIYSDEFREYRLSEYAGINEVSTGLPLNPVQEMARLWVASSRYEAQGYLQDIDTVVVLFSPLDIVTGSEDLLRERLTEEQYRKFKEKGVVLRFKEEMALYIDPYHFSSIPIYGVIGGVSQGSTRIILPSQDYGLPTFTDDSIIINPEHKELVSKSLAELSQFAIVKGAHPGMSGALLRSSVAISKALGINHWIATIDNFVVTHLNGAYFRFALPEIGPASEYLGSKSTPIFVDIDGALDNAENYDSSRAMARFIRGTEIPQGFEWYRGK